MTDDNSVQDATNKETNTTSRRRVLCQARGLSQDHNASTAFFDIPNDAPHGLLLVCSHSECANSQRRFRYCRGKLSQWESHKTAARLTLHVA
jgi:hypothetical protein